METAEIPQLDFRNYLSVHQKLKISPPSSQIKPFLNKNRSLFDGIFTVADSLKENYVIKSLKPDLGSLEEFVHLKEKPNFENYRQSLKIMKSLFFLWVFIDKNRIFLKKTEEN